MSNVLAGAFLAFLLLAPEVLTGGNKPFTPDVNQALQTCKDPLLAEIKRRLEKCKFVFSHCSNPYDDDGGRQMWFKCGDTADVAEPTLETLSDWNCVSKKQWLISLFAYFCPMKPTARDDFFRTLSELVENAVKPVDIQVFLVSIMAEIQKLRDRTKCSSKFAPFGRTQYGRLQITSLAIECLELTWDTVKTGVTPKKVERSIPLTDAPLFDVIVDYIGKSKDKPAAASLLDAWTSLYAKTSKKRFETVKEAKGELEKAAKLLG